MTAGWNDLPPEMRVMIIYRLDFISRAKLSACAKIEQQLVRNNPFKLEEIEIEKHDINLNQKGSRIGIAKTANSWTTVTLNYKIKRILENEHPKETVRKIFNSLGTKCIVGEFIFYVERGFIDMIEWFRDHLNFSPNRVRVFVIDDACQDIDPFINWPKNVKISLCCYHYHGPLFERLDKYDNVVEFFCHSAIKNADTTLMKLPNSARIELQCCDITIDSFLWWVKQWLVRDDYTELFFCAVFTPRPFIKVDEMKNGLGDFLIDSRKECKQSGVGSQEVCWYFFVRNKLNGRVGRIRLDKVSIGFDDNDEVQHCLNSLTIRNHQSFTIINYNCGHNFGI